MIKIKYSKLKPF